MTKSQRVAPVTAAELQSLFDRADVSLAWFCEATGADPRRVRRWLADAETIPLWAATFLLALCTPVARYEVSQWLQKYREPARPHARQSVPQEAQSAGPFFIEPRGRDGKWYRLSESHQTEGLAFDRACKVSQDVGKVEGRSVPVRVVNSDGRIVSVF